MTLPEVKIGATRSLDWRERLSAYASLTRLDRPIGIFLLLWPALWALWLAGDGNPPLGTVLIFMTGVVLMRSAGCAINDFADRSFDGQVARTRERPLATGRVSTGEALGIFAVLCLAAFALVLFLNWPTVALSVVALVLVIVYPFMKRFTHVPQLFLGAAFGWAVPMAFMAVTQEVPALAWTLFGTTLLWALIYDTQYAMVDREDDIRIGIKSTAILFGRMDLWIIAVLQLAMLALLAAVGIMAGRGGLYFGGLAAAGTMAAYQQYLVRNRTRSGCFQAFLNNNYYGMAVFIGLVLDYSLGG
jgi:4-hydroxybenzoate polyprenyltransferase